MFRSATHTSRKPSVASRSARSPISRRPRSGNSVTTGRTSASTSAKAPDSLAINEMVLAVWLLTKGFSAGSGRG